jgi:tetratricopeptide (TPR) repeat protein
MKSTDKSSSSDYTIKSNHANWILSILTIFLIARAVCAFLGSSGYRLWSIDFASYVIADIDTVIMLFLPVILLIKPIQRFLQKILTQPLLKTTYKKVYWFAMIVVLFLTYFVLSSVQISFPFLGDGSYYASEITRIVSTPGYSTSLIKPSSFLTGYVVQWTAKLFMPADPQSPFVVIGVLSAGILIVSFFIALRKEKKPTAIFMMVLLGLSNGTLLFFGYVELYTMTYTLTAIYFLTSWMAFRQRLTLWIPLCVLILAVLFGASSIMYLPSLSILAVSRMPREKIYFSKSSIYIFLFIAQIAGFVFLLIVFGLGNINPYIIPLRSTESVIRHISFGYQNYTLFNPAHLLDVLHALILSAGISGLLFIPLLFLNWRTIKEGDPFVLFYLSAALSGVLFVLGGNATFGLARDWDLATIAGLGIIFFVIMLVVRCSESRTLRAAALLPILALASFSNLYIWLKINSSPEASAKRFEDIVEMNKDLITRDKTCNAYEHLRKYYRSESDEHNYLRMLKKMIERGDMKPLSYNEYLGYIKTISDDTHRVDEFEWLYSSLAQEFRTSESDSSCLKIPEQRLREITLSALIAGTQRSDFQKTMGHARILQAGCGPWVGFNLLQVFGKENLPAEKVRLIAREVADSISLEPSLIIHLGNVFRGTQNYEEAAAQYEKALTLEKDRYFRVYMLLARTYYENLKDNEKAIRTLQRCILNCSGTPDAEQAKQLLIDIQKGERK